MRMFYRSRWCSFPFKAEVNSKCFLWISPAVLVTLAAPIYDVSIMGSVTFSWITWIFSWITQIQNTAQRIKYQEQYTCPSLSNSFILNFRASLQTLSDILHRKKKGAAFTSKKKTMKIVAKITVSTTTTNESGHALANPRARTLRFVRKSAWWKGHQMEEAVAKTWLNL